MAYQTRDRAPLLDSHTQAALERRGKELLGLGLLGAGLLALVMLATYSPEDPNWLLASDAPTQNWLGRFGASIAHPLMMIVGRAAWGLPLVLLAWGLRLATHRAEERARSVFAPIFVAALAAAFATLPPGEGWTQGYGPGGLFGDTALGFLLTVIPLGDLLVSLLVWAGALALGLFVLGVTRTEIRAARHKAALGLVLGYAWSLRTGARGLLHALDGYETLRARAAEAAALRAERAAAERARLEEEERAILAIPEPGQRPDFGPALPPGPRANIVRPQAPVPSRGHVMPPPLASGRPAPLALTEWDEGHEVDPLDGTVSLDGFDDLDLLADPDELEAELWAAPAEAPLPGIPPAPAFLKTPAPDHAPVLAAPARAPAPGLLTSLLRRVRSEPEPQPEEPAGDDVRIRARIGDAIRARIEAPVLRAEPPVEAAAAALPAAPVLRADPALPRQPEAQRPAMRPLAADREPVEAVVEAPAAPLRQAPQPAPQPAPRPAPVRPVPKAPAAIAYAPPPLDLLADPSEVQR
ncbi:MAG TPA: DNA translocase FtsK 4TM domain-containing protein, partial [Rubellimicrobium sp.]|nr:DNA translocase FtsK 4TM domain-containing protein [Rubellimicrobium sp.]